MNESERTELQRLLSQDGVADIYFSEGLIVAFACVDGSADSDFIQSELLGDDATRANADTNFLPLFNSLTTQILNQLYEYRYQPPSMAGIDSKDFQANFPEGNSVASWAKGLHTGLSFCRDTALANDREALAEVYESLLGFCCARISVFIDAEVATAIYQHQNLEGEVSIEEMMVSARAALPQAVKDLIEMAFELVTEA